MPNILGEKERRGGSGRVPDSKMKDYEKSVTKHYTCRPELFERLMKYCNDEERAQSWVIQKALDKWLSERGY